MVFRKASNKQIVYFKCTCFLASDDSLDVREDEVVGRDDNEVVPYHVIPQERSEMRDLTVLATEP